MNPAQNSEIERNLGKQPVTQILTQHGLKPHDLVTASATPISHKLIARACKGRRLTPHSQDLVLRALNQLTGRTYSLRDLFNY